MILKNKHGDIQTERICLISVSSERKCSSWLPVVAVGLLGLLLLAGITVGVHGKYLRIIIMLHKDEGFSLMDEYLGMGTEVDNLTDTDHMTSVLPGISSLKNERYLFPILLNAPVAGRVHKS